MNKKKPASIYTALRIPPDLRVRAKAKAAVDGRSLSNYIKHLIRKDLRLNEELADYPKTKKK